MKKILIVYPHDYAQLKMGIDTRFLELIRYFKTREYSVDLFALKNFVSDWEQASDNQDKQINRYFFFDFAESTYKSSEKDGLSYTELPDFAFKKMKAQFERIVSETVYDVVLISYLYWANLIDGKSYPFKKVLDLSDFTTLILHDMCDGKIAVDRIFNQEIERADLFDKVMCISYEEMWLFSQFAKKPKYTYIPHFMASAAKNKNLNETYDLLFIGSDNNFNVEGMEWFFSEIYPKLPKTLRMVIVGKITEKIPDSFPNVEMIPFVENLQDIYGMAKVLVVPLLGGTGIKIKVVEALSFGVPVVTTDKGVVGFKYKRRNGCLISNEAEGFAAHIKNLLDSPSEFEKISNQALSYFKNNFDRNVNYRNLDAFFGDEL